MTVSGNDGQTLSASTSQDKGAAFSISLFAGVDRIVGLDHTDLQGAVGVVYGNRFLLPLVPAIPGSPHEISLPSQYMHAPWP